MFSYKHGYHAGNHADVLKHLCLIYFLKTIKKPYNSIIYLDTHSGNGVYHMNHEYMSKKKEYLNGIQKIINFKTQDPYIRYYLNTIKNINQNKIIKFYPGSPRIAEYLTDAKDELYFCEIHSNEYNQLKKNFNNHTNIKIIKEDGFLFFNKKKLKKEKKGLILIDPSYEIKSDYQNVINFVKKNFIEINSKIILIWYPLINREETNNFINEFKKTGIKDILRIEMPITNDTDEKGMTGSGLIVLNSHKKTAQNLRGSIIELQNCLQIKENKKRVIINFLR